MNQHVAEGRHPRPVALPAAPQRTNHPHAIEVHSLPAPTSEPADATSQCGDFARLEGMHATYFERRPPRRRRVPHLPRRVQQVSVTRPQLVLAVVNSSARRVPGGRAGCESALRQRSAVAPNRS